MDDQPQLQSDPSLPDGDYAIVELFGHQTLVGRVAEVERFGAKMIQIESIFRNALLPAAYYGGSAIYAFTPCARDVALKRQPKQEYDLPLSLRAAVQPLLPPPSASGADLDYHDDMEIRLEEFEE